MSNIKYPIAYHLDSEQLINIKDAKSGIECNCICLECKNPLIAVNKEGNIQDQHFRHKSNVNCKGSFESFIHKISKDVFSRLSFVMLPRLLLGDLPLNNSSNYYSPRVGQAIENISHKLHGIRVFQSVTRLVIEDVPKKEFVFHSDNKHKIRADIVILKNNVPFLIEPFLSNKIDNNKRSSLAKLNLSCISIDLNQFINKYGESFTLEALSDFLQNDVASKKWENVRNTKITTLENTIKQIIESSFQRTDKDKNQFKELSKELDELKENQIKLVKKREKIQLKINRTQKDINALDKKILQKIRQLADVDLKAISITEESAKEKSLEIYFTRK